MNLRKKLTLGFFSMALVVGMASTVAILNENRLQEDIDELININIEENAAASDVAINLRQVEADLRALVMEPRPAYDPAQVTQAVETVVAGLAELDKAAGRMREAIASDLEALAEEGEDWDEQEAEGEGSWLSEKEELREVEELISELAVYRMKAEKLLSMVSERPTDADAHLAYFRNTLEPLFEDLRDEADEIREDALTEARGEGDYFRDQVRISLIVSVSMTLVGVLLAAVLGTYFARRFSKPVAQLKSAMGKVSRGQFDITLERGSPDEIGELAVAFVDMAGRLRDTMVSRNYVESIIASMSNALIVMSPEGQIQRMNRAATDLLGYEETELVGLTVGLIFVEDELLGKATEIAYLVESGFIQDSDMTLLTKSGRHVPVYLSTAVMRDEKNELDGIIFVATDISEEHRVARLKADFISTVSHELRTPLTSIKGSLGLAANGALGSLPERAQDMIVLANKNTDRLMNLVNDILDMDKLETGRMEFDLKPLDLSELVVTAVEYSQGFAMQHGVEFSVSRLPDGPTVRGDADRLTQVVVNLISNAAKFSPPGENVEIAVARENGFARVSVSDRGPGISAEYGNQIFEPFSQVDGSDHREKSGSGLGLSISKSIIEEHVGDIGFQSEVGVGSTFFFTLPVHPGS